MNTVSPLRALLREAIDYAGLFPPAGLDMAAAVRNYASYLAGEYSWMLGRFVVSSGRLDEFEKAASYYLAGAAGQQPPAKNPAGNKDPAVKHPAREEPAAKPWKIAILGKPEKPLHGRGFAVDAIELRAERIRDIKTVSDVETYFEVTPALALQATIEGIARADARAKIRTGGLTPEAFPETGRIAQFLSLCNRTKVAFKATAGLHHPVRGVHPFTYEPGSTSGIMQGFLNVFLAATLIFIGAGEQVAAQLLEERSPDAFRFGDEAVYWRSYRISREQIESARANFAISFGSCSFEEPVRELAALGLL